MNEINSVPKTELHGQLFEFDFPAFQVGVAEYGPGITGCTVFKFNKKLPTAIDIRGGDPAISEYQYHAYDAICFTGGSLQGLGVLSGVRQALFEEYGPERDLVSCAAVNDWYQRDQTVNPDNNLGYAAYKSAFPNRFLLGRHGAGTNVWVGGGKGRGVGEAEQTGQGAAFLKFEDVKIVVFIVVNSLGAILDRDGQVVCGNVNQETGERETYLGGLKSLHGEKLIDQSKKNTTLTLAITNQTLTYHQLRQVGRQIHSSLSRAIHPFHTIHDGDVLYMSSTSEVDNPKIDPVSLGLLGSEVAWDAALSSIGFPESDLSAGFL